MRSLLLSVAALALVSGSGCAHQSEMRETTTVITSPAPQPQGEVIAVDQQTAPEEAPRARPRITQTITLGQQNSEATYSAPAPPPGQQGQGGGTNVTVNNNVIVHQLPAVYGGWGGYGGYGSYGYSSRGYGVRTDGRGGSFGTRSGGATWGNTGWEGARGRPAAPGATPGVGGNWAPAPSYGPAQMK